MPLSTISSCESCRRKSLTKERKFAVAFAHVFRYNNSIQLQGVMRMKKMILLAGLVAACSASAQLLQNITQALVQPEPAPAPAAQPVQTVQPVVQPVQVVQPQTVVQPAVQQVTTTTVQPVQQVTTTTVVPAPVVVPQPAPVVVPPQPVVVAPQPVVVAPAGPQPCPRCGGRGKEEHALGFKVKRCKLCNGKGFLPPPPPPPPPVHHHHHHRY